MLILHLRHNLQDRSVNLQERSVNLQERSVNLQDRSVNLQDRSISYLGTMALSHSQPLLLTLSHSC